MRQLTADERDALLELWFKKLDKRDAMPEMVKHGFVAGLEYQDKRIEALINMLKAAGVSENIINGVLSEVTK